MALFYGIHDKWTDINKENDVLVQSTEGVIDSIKVNGEDYGGGGASDLSTAEVIVINQTELPVSFETALIVDEYDEKVFTASATVFGGQTKETEVVLYNGVSVDPTLINSHEVPVAIAVTGDIEIVEDYVMIVTGAGTITITAESET